MNKSSIEMTVGVFVLAGLICVGYLTVKLGKMEWIGENYYTVYAHFQSVTGLKPGATIEIAGVQVGKIESISLDTRRQAALVKLEIQNGIELADDVIASVKTSGLIGDKYIKLSPGGSDEILGDGDFITETESALDIEELVSKYVFGSI